METIMTQALKEAGIRRGELGMTQQERVWRWFKDHPRNTSTAASKALKIAEKTCASLCSQMVSRGMLDSTKDLRQPAGLGNKRMMLIFWPPNKLAEYEVLPVRAQPRLTVVTISPAPDAAPPSLPSPQQVLSVSPAPAPAPEEPVEAKPLTVDTLISMEPEDIMERLGVRKARELYDLLKEVFSG